MISSVRPPSPGSTGAGWADTGAVFCDGLVETPSAEGVSQGFRRAAARRLGTETSVLGGSLSVGRRPDGHVERDGVDGPAGT